MTKDFFTHLSDLIINFSILIEGETIDELIQPTYVEEFEARGIKCTCEHIITLALQV
jgi:hypothetical protein